MTGLLRCGSCAICQNGNRKIHRQTVCAGAPMYIDSHLLAPLISIAPETVELYTDKPEHMMSRTIQNVFQERVRLFPLGAFAAEKTEG